MARGPECGDLSSIDPTRERESEMVCAVSDSGIKEVFIVVRKAAKH